MKLRKKLGLGFVVLFLLTSALTTVLSPGNSGVVHALEENQYDGAQNSAYFCINNDWRSNVDDDLEHLVEAYCDPANLTELVTLDPCANGSNVLDTDKYEVSENYLIDFCTQASTINPETGITGGGTVPVAQPSTPEEQEEALGNDVAQGEGGATPIDNAVRQLRSRAGCYQPSSAIPVGAICGLTMQQTIDLCTSDQRSQPQYANAKAYIDTFCTQIKDWYGVGAPAAAVDDDDAAAGVESCEEADTFAWMGCPVIRGIDGALNWIQTNVQDILYIAPNKYENSGIHGAWVIFRNIATILLIIILLVMVLSTSLGFAVFDAYTVKKLFPRIVIGIILMQLSWALMTFGISFINTIGDGIYGLMLMPFGGAEATDLPSLIISGGGGALGGQGMFTTLVLVGVAAGGVALGFMGLISLAFTVFLMVLVGFFVLVIRNLVVIICLIMAPLAIAAWITPGSLKGWNLWWDSFSKSLLMYPLVMMLFAGGRILAVVAMGEHMASDMDIGSRFAGRIFTMILVVLAYAIPFFMIPFTLRFAGGLVATLGGFANNKSRGVFDRLQKGRQNTMAKNWQDTRNLHRFKGTGAVSKGLNRTLGMPANADKLGAKPWKWRGKGNAIIGETSMNQADAMGEDERYKRWKGNDNLNMWAAMSTDERSLRTLLNTSDDYERDDRGVLTADGKRNMEADVASVEAMRKKYGNDAMRQAAFVSAMAGGTALDKEVSTYETDATGKHVIGDDGKRVERKQTFSAAELQAQIAGGDRSIQASLVAKGRVVAGQAGRNDQGGISFGDGMGEQAKFRNGVIDEMHTVEDYVDKADGVAKQRVVTTRVQFDENHYNRTKALTGRGEVRHLHTNDNGVTSIVDERLVKTRAATQGTAGARSYTAEESVAVTRQRVKQRQGGYAIVDSRAKDETTKNLAPVLTSDIQQSLDAITDASLRVSVEDDGTTRIKTADEAVVEFVANMASAKAVTESLNSTSPNKAGIVQRQLTSQKFQVSALPPEIQQMLAPALAERTDANGARYIPTEITYSEALEAIEGNSQFQQFRREFEKQFERRARSAPPEGISPEERARWVQQQNAQAEAQDEQRHG